MEKSSFEEFVKRIPLWLLVLLVTISSLFISGYRFAYSDNNFYIPLVQKVHNPDLYPSDPLFDQPIGGYTYLPEILSFFLNYLDIQTLYILSYLLFSFIMFWSVAKITQTLFKKRSIVLIALLLTISPKVVAGTSILTFSIYMLPRFAAISISLFALYMFIKARYKSSSIVMGIALILHPPTVIALVAAQLFYLIKKKSVKKILISLLIFLIVSTPIIYSYFVTPKDTTFFPDPFHLSILTEPPTAKALLFPLHWHTMNLGLVSLLGLLVVIMIFLYTFLRMYSENSLSNKDIRILSLVLTSLFLLIINIIFGELFPISIIIQLTLARGLLFIYWISMVYFAKLLWDQRHSLFGKLLGILVISFLLRGVIFFVLGTILFAIGSLIRDRIALKNRIIKIFSVFIVFSVSIFIVIITIHPIELPHTYPNHDTITSDYVDVQLWSKNNTALDSKFIVPPITPNFRIFSERTPIISPWDEVGILVSPGYTKAWNQRRLDVWGFEGYYNNIDKYNQMPAEYIINLSKKYNASYLVSLKTVYQPFDKYYENNNFVVYRLTMS